MPLKSLKDDPGVTNVTVAFGGIQFVPGSFLYADEDGVVVCKENQFSRTGER